MTSLAAGHRPYQSQTINPGTDKTVSLDEIEKGFAVELEEANNWYAVLRQNELTWIQEGKDADAEFARTYYEEPSIVNAAQEPAARLLARYGAYLVAAAVFGQLILAGLGFILWMVVVPFHGHRLTP
jgi:hypothetical protein